ncbi:hypothetical protein EVC45_29265 [Paraburkholderia sp. UYCP14C]|nr:hypothetical protein EVC45_29265 [Paraburkholderia sp. UYCP14C]
MPGFLVACAERTLDCEQAIRIWRDVRSRPRRDGNRGPNDLQDSVRLQAARRARGWRKHVLLTVVAC